MNTSTKKFSTRTMVLIGLFSALCYVALFFKIPIPSPVGKPFLHMGNMFVILAALLFTGTIGGLSGSIGMGLFDLMNGYASSVPKTVLLKFGIGAIVGIVFSKGNKKDAKSPIKWIGIASGVLILTGIVLFVVSNNLGNQIIIEGIEKKLVINPVLYIFSLILGISLAIICIAAKNLSIKVQYAVLGAVAGIAFNLVGEFLFGVITLLIAGSGLLPAILSSAVSLPATLINGSFSIFFAVALYIPLSKTISKSSFTTT
ncbi:MAG: ECF transporter S component [Clostridium sp.]|uniref:ECF transporter S component n=1 Tax=Clostridium sp. TaxID=1506 RepID=UPI00303A7CAD